MLFSLPVPGANQHLPGSDSTPSAQEYFPVSHREASRSSLHRRYTSARPPNQAATSSKGARKNNNKLKYSDPGKPGLCRQPVIKPGKTRTAERMDWAKCRSELGVGWMHYNHCYGMEGAALLKQTSSIGWCFFSNQGWILPPPRPNIPVVRPEDPKPHPRGLEERHIAQSSSSKQPYDANQVSRGRAMLRIPPQPPRAMDKDIFPPHKSPSPAPLIPKPHPQPGSYKEDDPFVPPPPPNSPAHGLPPNL
ncbi:hypothetical protein Hypma_005142 [Hypsizygus marmoreus]|uniref:Uncharacterized protein n=1 Tax=Hypsizygus marmoreus TaxID=39966 RepID=A0A369K563_HYPMA|nr:hypothetical protein Hypma_005142 [Hypsizygus marmoreus]